MSKSRRRTGRTGTGKPRRRFIGSIKNRLAFERLEDRIVLTASFGPATNFAVPSNGEGVTSGDFNVDGFVDIAATNGDAVSVFLGTGTGSFATAAHYSVASNPWSIVTGDVNNDGRLDLVTANFSGSASVLLGLGDGRFSPRTDIATSGNSHAVALADFNGDGKLDIAAANYSQSQVALLLGDGVGQFAIWRQLSVGSLPRGIVTGDFNADGTPDVATADVAGNSATVLLSTATLGGYSRNSYSINSGSSLAYAIAAADIDSDGSLDLVTGNAGGTRASYFRNLGSGAFESAVAVETGLTDHAGIVLADFTLDGRPDIAVTNFGTGRVTVIANLGAGQFDAPTSFAVGSGPNQLATGDFNNDGKVDLVTANRSSHNISVLLNTASGVGGPQPTITLALDPLSDSGASSTDRITRFSQPTYQIEVGAAGVVQIDFNGDGTSDASRTVSSAGRYTFAPASPLGDGVYQSRAYFTPNGFGRVSSAPLTVRIDAGPPTIVSAVVTPTRSIAYSFNESIDAATVQATDLTVVGPAGPIEVLSVTVVGNLATFSVAPQVAPGTYRFTLAASVSDLAGNQLEAAHQATTEVTPKPDLTVTALSTVSHAIAGRDVSVTWTVKNEGLTAASGNWLDEIFLSSENAIGSDVSLSAFPFTGSIAIGDSISRTQVVRIPAGLTGEYRLVVRTDSGGNIAEEDEADNAAIASATITVVAQATPNLIVESISRPASAFSEQSISVEWTVKNTGNSSTSSLGWIDSVYLSLDGVLDGNDRLLGTVANSSYLNPGEVYQSTLSAVLPQGIDGSYRLIVVTDSGSAVSEGSFEGDNQRVSEPIVVSLTPPPDLIVTSVSAVSQTFSGERITVSWSVQNVGSGDARNVNWTDQVFLSFNGDTIDAADRLVASLRHEGPLAASGIYQVADYSIDLPFELSGPAHLIVRTNADGGLFEHVFRSNNERARGLAILASPTPDLVVSSLTSPANAVAGQPLSIAYVVTNEGANATQRNAWTTSFYLSPDDQFDPAADLLLGQQSHNGRLGRDESVANTFSTSLSNTISGDYYVFAVVDSGHSEFESDEANNIRRSVGATSIAVSPPDLRTTGGRITNSAASGRDLTVEYSVANAGPVPTPISGWTDAVYLSSDATLDAADTTLTTAFRTGVLAPGQAETRTLTTTLPTVVGDYFVIVVVDSTDAVYELNHSNNRSVIPISVRDDRPDLTVTSFVPRIPASPLLTGGSFAIDYSVDNLGGGATYAPNWNDALVLSADETLGNSDDRVIATFANNVPQAAGAAYSRLSQNVSVPAGLPAGVYRLFLQTDSSASQSESNEGNNSLSYGPVVVADQPPPEIPIADLQITSLSATAAVASGGVLSVTWQVSNNGIGRTSAASWTDRIWLSQDGVVDSSDIFMGAVTRTSPLAAGESYSRTLAFPTDVNLSGEYFVIVRTDADSSVLEGLGESNNERRTATASAVTLSPTADLQVASITPSGTLTSGRSATLNWTVGNTGAAPAAGGWYDSVYLSLDPVYDPATDISLGYSERSALLGPGATYVGGREFNIPASLGGLYYIIVVTDSTNRVFERNAEANNTRVAAQAVDIVHAPPADLVVGEITIPANGIPGQDATISFTVNNLGANPAIGSWADAIYLSADDRWDVGDAFFGRVTHSGNVLAGGSYSSTLTAPLPGIVPGNYRVIVRSDIRNNLVEANESNNLSASLDLFALDFRSVTLGETVTGVLEEGRDIYYRVSSTEGETLAFEFTVDGVDVSTELYVAKDDVPSPTSAEFSSTTPHSSLQRVLIPTSTSGTYYVRLRAVTLPEQSAAFSFTARAVSFTIFDRNFGVAGNAGDRTLSITGAKFDSSLNATLRTETGHIVANATKLLVSSSTRAFVTFDLRSVAPGTYSVHFTSAAGAPQVIADGFAVVQGGGGQLSFRTDGPTFVRPGEKVEYTLTVANTGRNDLEMPLLEVASNGATFTFTGEPTANTRVSETLLAVAKDGDPRTLRPGEIISIPIFAVATTATTFRVSVLDDDLPLQPLDQLMSVVRANLGAGDTESEAWSRFSTSLGGTAASFRRNMIPTELSEGRPTFVTAAEHIRATLLSTLQPANQYDLPSDVLASFSYPPVDDQSARAAAEISVPNAHIPNPDPREIDKAFFKAALHPITLDNSGRPHIEPTALIDREKPTVIIAHGWGDSGSVDADGYLVKEWIENLAEAILASPSQAAGFGRDTNLLVLDWAVGAFRSKNPATLIPSADNSQRVGNQLWKYIVSRGINPESVTLIGHSLGGQLMGRAGHAYHANTGNQINRIIGLDEAGWYFSVFPDSRLDRYDAKHVVSLKSSIWGLDEATAHGTFYINAGVRNIDSLSREVVYYDHPYPYNGTDEHDYGRQVILPKLLRGDSVVDLFDGVAFDFRKIVSYSGVRTLVDNYALLPDIQVARKNLVTTEDGGIDAFDLRLLGRPVEDVYAQIIGDSTEGFASVNGSQTIRFWSDPTGVPDLRVPIWHRVTIVGLNDGIVDGDHTYPLRVVLRSEDSRFDGIEFVAASVTNRELGTFGIELSHTSLETSESGEADFFLVRLKGKPTSDVVLRFAPDETEGTLNRSTVTFDASNWNKWASVLVKGDDDSEIDGDVAYPIGIVASSRGDARYNFSLEGPFVINVDDDVAGVVFDRRSIATSESGEQGSFSVKLKSRPSHPVLLTLIADEEEGRIEPLFPPQVTIQPDAWDQWHTVTVFGVDDDIADATQVYDVEVRVASSDPNYGSIGTIVGPRVLNRDDDGNVGFVVEPDVIMTTEDGGTATFAVHLKTQPLSGVSVSLVVEDSTEGSLSPSILSFSTVNWNVPQMVTVRGVDDSIIDEDTWFDIFLSASSADSSYGGLSAFGVSVINVDNDGSEDTDDPGDPGDPGGPGDPGDPGDTLPPEPPGEGDEPKLPPCFFDCEEPGEEPEPPAHSWPMSPVAARDPNDIVGPAGVGPARIVSAALPLSYKVRFENDPLLATAPAQVVRVVQRLDADLDARSFRLGSFGFAGLKFDIPENRAFYQTRLDLRTEFGIFVDVLAGIDVGTGEIFWQLSSVDPATGELPINPLVGFLFPNLAPPQGDGFLNYSIRPKQTASSGSRIDAQARIFFDRNAPIDTAPIFNTLDADAPTSALAPLPSISPDNRINVSWSGGDGDSGSGLTSYDVYVSTGSAPYSQWLADTKLTSAEYLGEPGRTYRFYSVARDAVGNGEAAPLVADARTTIPGPPGAIDRVVLQDGLMQKSFVDGFRLEFNRVLGLQTMIDDGSILSAVRLTNLGANAPLDADVVVTLTKSQFRASVDESAGRSILSWSLDSFTSAKGSLADGYYRLEVDGALLRDAGAVAIDGDRDGSAGGVATYHFHRLAGDANGDRVVDATDSQLVNSALGGRPGVPAWNANADLDRDGVVTTRDRLAVARATGSAIIPTLIDARMAGDYNNDGTIDAADLAYWGAAFGESGIVSRGDGDNDGDVDGTDFLVWQRTLGSTVVVVEPSAVIERAVHSAASAATNSFTASPMTVEQVFDLALAQEALDKPAAGTSAARFKLSQLELGRVGHGSIYHERLAARADLAIDLYVAPRLLRPHTVSNAVTQRAFAITETALGELYAEGAFGRAEKRLSKTSNHLNRFARQIR